MMILDSFRYVGVSVKIKEPIFQSIILCNINVH